MGAGDDGVGATNPASSISQIRVRRHDGVLHTNRSADASAPLTIGERLRTKGLDDLAYHHARSKRTVGANATVTDAETLEECIQFGFARKYSW